MSGLEASENACLVFRGADEESQKRLINIVEKHMVPEHRLAQVRHSVPQLPILIAASSVLHHMIHTNALSRLPQLCMLPSIHCLGYNLLAKCH